KDANDRTVGERSLGDRRGGGKADAGRFPSRRARPHRTPPGLRAWTLWQLPRAGGRGFGPILPDVRRPGRWLRRHHRRGARTGGSAPSAPGVVLGEPRAAVRLLHAGHAADFARAPRNESV